MKHKDRVVAAVQETGDLSAIESVTIVAGGDVNDAFKVSTEENQYAFGEAYGYSVDRILDKYAR